MAVCARSRHINPSGASRAAAQATELAPRSAALGYSQPDGQDRNGSVNRGPQLWARAARSLAAPPARYCLSADRRVAFRLAGSHTSLETRGGAGGTRVRALNYATPMPPTDGLLTPDPPRGIGAVTFPRRSLMSPARTSHTDVACDGAARSNRRRRPGLLPRRAGQYLATQLPRSSCDRSRLERADRFPAAWPPTPQRDCPTSIRPTPEDLVGMMSLLNIWLLRDIRFVVTPRSLSDAKTVNQRFLDRRLPAIEAIASSLEFQFGDWTVTAPSYAGAPAPVGKETGLPPGADRDLVLEAQAAGAHVFLTRDRPLLNRVALQGRP